MWVLPVSCGHSLRSHVQYQQSPRLGLTYGNRKRVATISQTRFSSWSLLDTIVVLWFSFGNNFHGLNLLYFGLVHSKSALFQTPSWFTEQRMSSLLTQMRISCIQCVNTCSNTDLLHCGTYRQISNISYTKSQNLKDTERTRFCSQTDKRTRWNQYTPLSTSLKRGYNDFPLVLWLSLHIILKPGV